jgi:FkbM family methyltransferase
MQNPPLIYDVGAHKGEDTAFYLRKGFRVVAIEANPEFCEVIKQKFATHFSEGALTVVNIAIADKSGSLNFYIDESISIWGTVNAEFVERNRELGAGKVKTLTVSSARLSDVIAQYGVPYYCKIDIEGNDVQALKSLDTEHSPKFISIEAEKSSWENLINEFRLLEDLGYRKYKIIDQSLVSFQRPPLPALEGDYVDLIFENDTSGLFGDELPGTWLSALEAIETYKNIFRGYALNGDRGLFGGGKKSLFGWIAALQRQVNLAKGFKSYENPVKRFPPAGWYDTHAAKA